jgi:3-oxoadipate enol-lactonase
LPFARVNGVTHHYERAGPQSGLAVVFVNSLGTDFRIWREVADAVASSHPVLLYDKRGHGLSDVGETPYGMAMLADDLAALMSHVGIGRSVICGVSVGGVIAQQLHARRPDLVGGMMLCDTLPKIGDDASWNDRIARIEAGGIALIADAILQRWFSPDFFEKRAVEADGYRNMLVRQPAAGYVATCVALREADLTGDAARIAVPTLCVAGAHDGSTPPDKVAAFAKTIRGARFERIAACGHIPSIEQPWKIVELLTAFLSLVATETDAHAGS